MDYMVGGVAAIISGNVTPNRPNIAMRPLTPKKHQPSPNVTPKSEMVDDRSVFLSPSVQKKKAIVKKSPKRIFQSADLDVTNDGEATSHLNGSKADKVKKHLKKDLENENCHNETIEAIKSPKNKRSKSTESPPTTENGDMEEIIIKNVRSTPKKKKQRKSGSEPQSEMIEDEENITAPEVVEKNINNEIKSNNNENEEQTIDDNDVIEAENIKSPKKKKNKKSAKSNLETEISVNDKQTESTTMNTHMIENDNQNSKKKNKKRKKSKSQNKIQNVEEDHEKEGQKGTGESTEPPKKKKKQNKNHVNPNAITHKDSDSEHESDNEIEESENEQSNKEILNTGLAEDSSDDDEKEEMKPETKVEVNIEEEVKRTLFIGNVPFTKKCKKEIKKIFSKYGEINSIRIRTVPVKDASVTPKLAIIKSELHPDRSTVNVYVKFNDPASVGKALAENNTVLNDYHLRVTRSDNTGADHDPRCSVFVGNIPFTLEDEALRSQFEKCGEITSVRIIRDKKTNAGKGFGYVNFATKDGVELALKLSDEDLTLRNRILRVKRCTHITQKNKQGPHSNQKGKNFMDKVGMNLPGNSVAKYQRDGQNKGKDGASRRIMNKKGRDGDFSQNNRQNTDQPNREKKSRKEFVGITAEKKKKQKFNKGLKKKKILSEILTK